MNPKRNTEEYKKEASKIKAAILQEKLEGLILVAGSADVVAAFKNKQPLKSGNYESKGNSFHLFGHKIAEHSDAGLRVSNAGYDTPTTYKALKQLGVKAEVKGGVAHINDKPYTKHGSFVTVPYKDVSDTSLIKSKGPVKDRTGFKSTTGINKLRQFADKARKRDDFLDQTAIQPEHQKIINKITGIKSKIPKKTIGTSVHHIFPKSAMPGLAHNLNNAITLSRNTHAELHRLNPEIVKKAKEVEGKLQKIAVYKKDSPHRGPEPTSRYSPLTPLKNEVPFGKEDRTPKEQSKDFDSAVDVEMKRDVGIDGKIGNPDYKVRPPKPTQKDRVRIISAKLQRLAMGNLENDSEKILARFNSSLNKYRKSVAGTHQSPSLNDEGFKEVFRTDAVKHGNRYKKLTGNHPEGIEEVLKSSTKGAAYSDITPILNHPDNKEEPNFSEAQRVFNTAKYEGKINHKNGFSFIPKDRKVYDANKESDAKELQKRFGNGRDPVHIIARTDNHSEYLDENHKFNGKTLKEHYNDIVKEGKTPIIGGFDEGKFKTTDVTTAEPLSDDKAREHLKKFNQRSSGRIDKDGKFTIFS